VCVYTHTLCVGGVVREEGALNSELRAEQRRRYLYICLYCAISTRICVIYTHTCVCVCVCDGQGKGGGGASVGVNPGQ